MNKSPDSWAVEDNKFRNPQGKAEGCVAVTWQKEIWADDHWKGTIKYEWLLSVGDDAIVAYGLYSTETDNEKIRWRAVYANKNTVKTVQEFWDKPRSDMPKNPKFSRNWEEYWGFNPYFDRICPQGKCDGTSKEKKWYESKWTWREESKGRDKFSSWAKNFDTAFSSLMAYLFQRNTDNKFNQLIERQGTWIQR